MYKESIIKSQCTNLLEKQEEPTFKKEHKTRIDMKEKTKRNFKST